LRSLSANFPQVVVLPAPCRPQSKIDTGGRGRQVELIVHPLAHQSAEFLAHDLDDLLCRGKALQNLLPDGPLTDSGNKVLDHAKVDVGLKKDQANLAEGFLYILFAQPAVAAQFLENRVEFFRQIVEHARPGAPFLERRKMWTIVKHLYIVKEKQGEIEIQGV
jgi:hypothetical protein